MTTRIIGLICIVQGNGRNHGVVNSLPGERLRRQARKHVPSNAAAMKRSEIEFAWLRPPFAPP